MDVKIDSPNAITLRLDPGETLYHPMRFLRSRGFGARLIAPWPLRAPLGRLWHRAYRMGVLSAPLTGDALTAPKSPATPPVQAASPVGEAIDSAEHQGDGPVVHENERPALSLVGTSALGSFEVLHIEAGQTHMVNLAHLAAVIVPTHLRVTDGPPVVRAHLAGLLNPSCWLLGHPVPTLFSGPLTLVLYGVGLRRRGLDEPRDMGRRQLVSFDTQADLAIKALTPQNRLAHVINALTFRSRVEVGDADEVLMLDYKPEEHGALGLLREFALHIALTVLLALLGFYGVPV